MVTAINGKAIATTDQFIATSTPTLPGQTITLTVKRGGQAKQIKVKLGTRPAQPARRLAPNRARRRHRLPRCAALRAGDRRRRLAERDA